MGPEKSGKSWNLILTLESDFRSWIVLEICLTQEL